MSIVFLYKNTILENNMRDGEKMLEKLKRIFYRSIANNEINYKTAKQMILKSPDIILLDVRSKQEYKEGNLSGSINLCLYDLNKQAQDVLKDKNKTIIVYCSSGNRSKEAQQLLEKMGYENVYNLKGGLDNI